MRIATFICVLLAALTATSAALACSFTEPSGIVWPERGEPLPANASLIVEAGAGLDAVLINGEAADLVIEALPSPANLEFLVHTEGQVTAGDVVEVIPLDLADENSDYLRLTIDVVEPDAFAPGEAAPSARYFYRHMGAVHEGDQCAPHGDWSAEASVSFDLPDDGFRRLVMTVRGDHIIGHMTPHASAFTTDAYIDTEGAPPCVTAIVDDLHGGRWTEVLCEPELCAVGDNSPLPPSATQDSAGTFYAASAGDWESVPADSCDPDSGDGQQAEGDDQGNCAVVTPGGPVSWLHLLMRR